LIICNKFINIDLSSFFIKYLTNINVMFYNYNNLVNIDLSSFDTKNETNMKELLMILII